MIEQKNDICQNINITFSLMVTMMQKMNDWICTDLKWVLMYIFKQFLE